jgi:membrane protein DedA with SNARE-associated domain
VEEFAQHFSEWLDAYGYPVLFIGILLENLGVPVPGETALLLAGLLASREESHFTLLGVILVTIVAAVIGDNLGFYLGHRYARSRLQAGKRFLFLTPSMLQLAEGYFQRYGIWTVAAARFITGLRVVCALAAGTAGMHWKSFLIANVVGAAAWAVSMSVLGYFFGHSWHLLHQWIGRGGLIILGSIVLIVGLTYLLRRLHKVAPEQWRQYLRPQIGLGVLAAVLELVGLAILLLLARGHRAAQWELHLDEWIGAQSIGLLNGLAVLGSFLGILPLMLTLAVLMTWWLRSRQRSGREIAVVWWSLVASEVVGLLLLALIRHRGIEPARSLAWPYGFAGLEPLRAAALIGMTAWLIGRIYPQRDRLVKALALLLVLWIGFGIVWLREQYPTEVLLEIAAGGVVLFAGVWWLEGYGPGVAVPPSPEPSLESK